MAVVIATTSIELIIGFLVVLWRRSSDKTSRVVKQLAVPLKEEEDEFEVASGKTRVTIFSRTQTSTAEEGAMTTCIPAGIGKLHFRVRDFNAQGCRKASWVTFSELSWSRGVSKFLQIQRCNSSQSPINESSKPLRTITSSSLRDGSTKFFNFTFIGSGVAGLRYALEVAKHGSVAVITKAEPHESNTNYAQGGVGAVLCPSDSVESCAGHHCSRSLSM